MLATCIRHIWVYSILITLSGDIEKNPGHKPSSCDKFSTHNFDILCLSETYLDSTISSNDNNLTIPCYDLHRTDHPSDVKRWRVCIYYKNFLPLKLIDIQYLQECINFEMKIGEKLCNFIVLYR